MMIRSLNGLRSSTDIYDTAWFNEACINANEIESVVKCPRICEKQTQRSSTPADDNAGYFRITISIPVLVIYLRCFQLDFQMKIVDYKGTVNWSTKLPP